MASYLQIDDLTKSYGTRMLFQSVTFGVEQGDKIAIIAKNGTGKSTLLNIIAGNETPDSGTVTYREGIRVGYVSQSPDFNPDHTVLQACLGADTAVTQAIANYESIIHSSDTDAIAAAIVQMDATSAWDYDDRLKQLLHQLHITDLNAKVATMSGGQLKRIAIARTILDAPDIYILDEPTNHLDVEIIEWLESFLTRQNVTLLMVTHDRYFLDRVCNRIIEIDAETIFSYNGNFQYYLRKRAERIETLNAEMSKIKNTLRKEQEWMSRQPQARAGKAKFRIDEFHRLKERMSSAPSTVDKTIDISDVSSSRIGSKIFEARNISKSFDKNVILSDFSYTFSRGEKLGIIGANGTGKSTFIKLLQGLIPSDSGTWDVGTTVRFGYYSQQGIEFDENKKVIDAVSEIADYIVIDEKHRYTPMQFLSMFLFPPADQQKYIHTLSGGERCRLYLATVLMRRPNFLILDEPTNDLDILTLGVLEEYLRNFKGCLIVISHDRFFLDSIVDHLFVFQGQGVVRDFPGSYSDYREYVRRLHAEKTENEQISNATTTESSTRRQNIERPRKLTFKERKEFEQLSADIDLLTARKKELDDIFASGTTIENAAELAATYSSISEQLNEMELRWLELSEFA